MNGRMKIYATSKAPPKKCELCGKVEETRPYGPNGEHICFDCGMLDEETTRKKFNEIFADCDLVVAL